MSKKVFIRTFGCQMNARDSEVVAGILMDAGYRLSDSADKADVVLFNSCSVRKHAEDRLFGNIAELKGLKKKRPRLVIALMGCTAQNYKHNIFKKAPLVDIVCGPGNEFDLPVLIENFLKTRSRIVAVNKVDKKRPEVSTGYRNAGKTALVSIGEGCNNFCSYCIVPYVRGKERYRDVGDIVREVRDLAACGYKEIMLLGQNVNSYGRTPNSELQTPNFVHLLEALNGIDGIERIKFMTSHPKDASKELFGAIASLEKVCKQLHLPVQSGSDRILKLMSRGYTSKRYLKLVEDYKKMVPGGSITTDILVGFPTETERDFKATYDIMKKIRFNSAFIFKYSPRPPAKAAKMTDDVTRDVKEERHRKLLELQRKISGEGIR